MRRSTTMKSLLSAVLIAACALGRAHAETPADPALVDLGRALFFDTNLSLHRTQSCATCHDPTRAFIDSRDNGVGGAVSLGDDSRSLGDRNAPSLTYAGLTPPLHRNADGAYVGGLFHDGRARDLSDQAGQPMLNPLEMQMPDAAAVVARVNENPMYVEAIRRIFGRAATDSVEQSFLAVRTAIAAFEQTALFAAYDSKYDRHLRGEALLTPDEELGRMLFFSSLTNCSSCHVLDPAATNPREPFTSFQYFNIGIPANSWVRAINSHPTTDRGLRDNPAVADDAQAGKFRAPTLRNVAVTAPYMHNGVFRELTTVLFFYNQYLASNERNATNPETGAQWGPPEIPATVDRKLLRAGQPLDDARIAALIAFLRTLTDQRYEALLQPPNAAP